MRLARSRASNFDVSLIEVSDCSRLATAAGTEVARWKAFSSPHVPASIRHSEEAATPAHPDGRPRLAQGPSNGLTGKIQKK
jgi:hypothetical protein